MVIAGTCSAAARREAREQQLKEERQATMEDGLAQAWANGPEDEKNKIRAILGIREEGQQ